MICAEKRGQFRNCWVKKYDLFWLKVGFRLLVLLVMDVLLICECFILTEKNTIILI